MKKRDKNKREWKENKKRGTIENESDNETENTDKSVFMYEGVTLFVQNKRVYVYLLLKNDELQRNET